MNNNLLGILIIVGIIILGIASGGDIFRANNGFSTSPSSRGINAEAQNRAQTQREINSISRQISNLSQDVQEYIENQNASVYKDRVILQGISQPGTFLEYATLRANLGPGEEVNITGWKLKSVVTGNEFVIGNGVNIPSFGPRNGEPIVLSRGNRAILANGPSPVGMSFRINTCTGFFKEDYNFNPTIPSQCPAPIEDAPPLSGSINNECLDYIESLPRCEVPRRKDIPEDISRSCKEYVENNIGYDMCVTHHINDIDFLKPEWRIFSKSARILWLKQRDVVRLLDNYGRIVDTYEI